MKTGDRVGRFEILGELGSGGMGVLYRARDPKLGREVAIKLLTDQLSESSEHRLRFEQEAQAASMLGHPNIVTIYEIGDHDGLPYIAMEVVEGRSLRDLIEEGFPSIKNLVSVAMQIAHGLAAAHEKGITHRDLKPENVMVTRRGLVKLLDFGLAKITPLPIGIDEPTADFEIVTQPGRVLGTVGYMSPEQARGLRVDFRSDQFALGGIVYEMLAGRRPFRGGTPLDTLSAILNQEPEPLAELVPRTPQPLVWLAERCLAKDPDARYASTLDIARELESILARMSETGTLTSTIPLVVAGRRRWLPFAIGAGAVAAFLLAFGLFLRLSGAPGEIDVAARGTPPQRVVVLPFRDLSGTPSGSLVGEGFAETVSVRLGESRALALLPTDALDVAGSDLLAAARRSGAELILRGSLQFEGERVRATYTLIAAAGEQIAAGSAEGTGARLLDLQDEVARSVARALGIVTGAAEPGPRTFDQDRYLEALGHLRRYENPASVDSAIATLEDLGGSAAVLSALARAYLAKYSLTEERRWVERAIATSQRAVELDPANGRVRETLGQVELQLGDPESAEREFASLLAAQPNSGEAQLGLAKALDQQGKTEPAERAYRRAIRMLPGWWGPHNSLGVFLLYQGRLDEATRSFEEAIRISPDNTRAITNLGTALQQMGKHPQAIAEYERSIAIRPTPFALSNLGTCRFMLGRYGQAAEAYRRAAALQPSNAVVWLNLGDALRWSGEDPAEANAAYRRTVELLEADLEVTPRDADRLLTLALALAHLGEPESARRHARGALDIDSSNSYFIYQAALVELATGDREAALDGIDRALRAGYPVESVLRDPELEALKNHPRFAILVPSSPAS